MIGCADNSKALDLAPGPLAPGEPFVRDAPARAAAAAQKHDLRAFAANDVPAVARLFQASFAPRAALPALGAYLRDLFLRHPDDDPACASRVYVGPDGAVRGFLGVLPVRMTLDERPLRAALATSLMVEDPAADPLAGARLMKSFFAGPQDLSFGETANPTAQRMWELLGGRVAPLYSMEWMQVLRPAGAAIALAGERFAPLQLLHPAGTLADRLVGGLAARLLGPDEPLGPATVVEVGDHAMADVLPRFSAHYPLRPDWTAQQLRWRLAQAERKEAFGDFVRALVIGPGDNVLGCFLYHVRRHGIAQVLQVLAHPSAADAVTGALIRHAKGRGAVALRGKFQPDLVAPLLRRRAFLRHRAAMMVHAADPRVLDAIARGDALLTGLATEAGTRLVGGRFG